MKPIEEMNREELIAQMEEELKNLWAQMDDRTKAKVLAYEIFKKEHLAEEE